MSTPKTGRIKHRLTTKEQIISQIDKFSQKRDAKHLEAGRLLSDAKHLRRMAAEPNASYIASMLAEANTKDHRAEKLGKQVKRLEEKVLPVWKRKLAEFQIDVIPGMLPDNSVEAPE